MTGIHINWMARLLLALPVSFFLLCACEARRQAPEVFLLVESLDEREAALYAMDDSHGELEILCKDISFALAARPASLLPDLPQIREYFANYYRLHAEHGLRPPYLSEVFRAEYGPYIRVTKADLSLVPPRIVFEHVPKGDYILFLAPEEQVDLRALDALAVADGRFSTAYMLRIRVEGDNSSVLELDHANLPGLCQDDLNRNVFGTQTALPPEACMEDVIVLKNGERLHWPRGKVLGVPVLGLAPEKASNRILDLVLFPVVLIGILGHLGAAQ